MHADTILHRRYGGGGVVSEEAKMMCLTSSCLRDVVSSRGFFGSVISENPLLRIPISPHQTRIIRSDANIRIKYKSSSLGFCSKVGSILMPRTRQAIDRQHRFQENARLPRHSIVLLNDVDLWLCNMHPER
jgi:hypothetical protein